jgi:DNA-binding NtrC family response regulator
MTHGDSRGAGSIMVEQTYQLLVADDDEAFRRAICEILAPFFRLIEADSGEAALELAAREEVHLALFDMHMKQLTGLETLRQLRSLHVVAPCILMTADYTEALCGDAEKADAFTVLRKPVTRRDLVGSVACAVETAYDDHELPYRLMCG